jgi:hypothetical protein
VKVENSGKLLLLITISFISIISYADDKIPLRITEKAGAIHLDGELTEEAWQRALKIDLRYEIDPGKNSEAPVKTTVFITHDQEFLYVAFRAEDTDPKAVVANYRDRDNLSGDDYVGIELDTFNIEKSSFSFYSNPLGIQSDSTDNETEYSSGESWDAIWESAGQLTSYGYSVEMKIPFSVLRFPDSGEEMVWGIFATRNYPRNVVHTMRNARVDRGRNCQLCQAQKLVGFQGVKPGKNIELTPTFSALKLDGRQPFPQGDLNQIDSTGDFGISGRWGVTPNSTFSGAINPDFSQIEADSLELDINRQFAIYYDEKRTFFLEGEEFFKGLHTRTIADPKWGAKYTHRQAGNSIGFLSARDRVTSLLLPGAEGSDQTTLQQENSATSLRYTRDIWNRSTMGVVVTDRRGGNYANDLFGIDGTLRLGRHDTLSFDLAHTRTRYEDEMAEAFGQPKGEFSGNSLALNYEHSTRNWTHAASYTSYDNDFRADMDFISQVGYRNFYLGGGPVWWGGKDDFYKRITWSLDYYYSEKQNGSPLERSWVTAVIAYLPLQTIIFSGMNNANVWFAGDEYNLTGGHFIASVKPLPYLKITNGFIYEEGIDYLGRRPGQRLTYNNRAFLDIGRHLRLETKYVYTSFSVDDKRLYLTNTLEGKLLWQINANTYLRTILQFADIRRNQDMYAIAVNDINRRFFGQLLFSYKLNPRTVLYLGYNSNSRGTDVYGLTQDSQMFFFKVGYAFLM